jgi:hypothetical protein
MTAEEVLMDEWIVFDIPCVHYFDLLVDNEIEVVVPSVVMC